MCICSSFPISDPVSEIYTEWYCLHVTKPYNGIIPKGVQKCRAYVNPTTLAQHILEMSATTREWTRPLSVGVDGLNKV